MLNLKYDTIPFDKIKVYFKSNKTINQHKPIFTFINCRFPAQMNSHHSQPIANFNIESTNRYPHSLIMNQNISKSMKTKSTEYEFNTPRYQKIRINWERYKKWTSIYFKSKLFNTANGLEQNSKLDPKNSTRIQPIIKRNSQLFFRQDKDEIGKHRSWLVDYFWRSFDRNHNWFASVSDGSRWVSREMAQELAGWWFSVKGR